MMFKLAICLLISQSSAFAPAFGAKAVRGSSSPPTASKLVLSASTREGGVASELGIPCEEECQIESYPNLPDSVHPGVLSGQAMMDLLLDAKEKGKKSN